MGWACDLGGSHKAGEETQTAIASLSAQEHFTPKGIRTYPFGDDRILIS
jgi:hypothetical protein